MMTNEEIEKPFRDLLTLDVECWNPKDACAPFVEIARALVTQAYEEAAQVATTYSNGAVGAEAAVAGAIIGSRIQALKDSVSLSPD